MNLIAEQKREHLRFGVNHVKMKTLLNEFNSTAEKRAFVIWSISRKYLCLKQI